MNMFDNMSAIDFLMVFLYVVFFAWMSFYACKKVKNSRDFSMAGQGLSWIMVAGSTIATTMGGNMVIGKYDLIMESGLSGLTASLFWWVGWIFLLVMAKPFRDSGATSIPNFLEKRFNSGTRKIASYCVLISVISSCAATFLAIGTVFESLGLCDKVTGTLAGVVIVILFTLPSGLWGVALTDTVQAVIILITFGLIFPVMVFRIAGGWNAVIASQTAERLNPFSGIAPVTMLGWAVSYALATGAEPNFAQRIFSARTTRDAIKGQVAAWAMSLAVAGIISALPALAIKNIFPEMTAGSQFTVRFIVTYFPVVLKGLILSVLLGLMLTSGDSYLLLLASTFTDDIVRPRVRGLSEKNAFLIMRAVCVISSGLLCAMALYVNKIYLLFKIGASAYGAGVFFPLLLGCFWKKCSAKAAGAAMLAGCLFSFCFDMFLKVPLGLDMDGVIIGSALNVTILVAGSLWLNARETA